MYDAKFHDYWGLNIVAVRGVGVKIFGSLNRTLPLTDAQDLASLINEMAQWAATPAGEASDG
jgi:hypothetical protein